MPYYLMFLVMFHIQIQLMQRLDQWNEYVCMLGHSDIISMDPGGPRSCEYVQVVICMEGWAVCRVWRYGRLVISTVYNEWGYAQIT
jgi:hypothetical protein